MRGSWQDVQFILPHPRQYRTARAWWAGYLSHLQLLAAQGWDLEGISASATRLVGRFAVYEEAPATDDCPVLLARVGEGRSNGWWTEVCLNLLDLEQLGLELTWLELVEDKLVGLLQADGVAAVGQSQWVASA